MEGQFMKLVGGIPAYSVLGFCGSITMEVGADPNPAVLFGKPESAGPQFAPPSVLLNSPAFVAAKIVPGCCGSKAVEWTSVAESPEFTAFQLLARSELLKTPEPPVAA